MVTEDPPLSLASFFGGKMTEEERLSLLDNPELVNLLRDKMPSFASCATSQEKSDTEKLMDLLVAGEIEFARDLIASLSELVDHEELLKGGRIDHNGRPWPSDFCVSLKEKAQWSWREEKRLTYQMFAMLAATCPNGQKRDASLNIDRIESLNLGEEGAEAFYGGINEFPQLTDLSVTSNHKDLAAKCPKLRYLDFRRCEEGVDLSLLADCKSLEHLNLLNTGVENLRALPALPNLRRIDLRRCWKLKEIESMIGSESLRRLDLDYCGELDSLGDPSRFPALNYLSLKGCNNVAIPDNLENLGISKLTLPDDEKEN